MDRGWVKIWRRTKDSWVWADPKRFRAWASLLIDASHKEGWVHHPSHPPVKVMPGQILTSKLKLAEEWDMARNTVKSFLAELEAAQQIEQLITNRYTLITIKNWELYQGADQPVDQQSDQPLTSSRPATDHVQELQALQEGSEEESSPPAAKPVDHGAELKELRARYPDGDLIDDLIDAFAKTRSNYKIADSVVARTLRSMASYDIELVYEMGRKYLDANYADEGKPERYLIGMLRNEAKRKKQGKASQHREPVEAFTIFTHVDLSYANLSEEIKIAAKTHLGHHGDLFQAAMAGEAVLQQKFSNQDEYGRFERKYKGEGPRNLNVALQEFLQND